MSQRRMVNTYSEQGNAQIENMDLNVAAMNGNDGPTASAEPPRPTCVT